MADFSYFQCRTVSMIGTWDDILLSCSTCVSVYGLPSNVGGHQVGSQNTLIPFFYKAIEYVQCAPEASWGVRESTEMAEGGGLCLT